MSAEPDSQKAAEPSPLRVLFVFLDGVGLGPSISVYNPLAQETWPALERLAGGQRWTDAAAPLDEDDHVFRSLDATLGVDGLPQSGTGQATLFTGVNCARAAGRHFGPFPHSKTKPILARDNVFSQLQRLGRFGGCPSKKQPSEEQPSEEQPSAFANAYPPRFFDHVRRRDRWTVTTRCCMEAGVPVRSLDALKEGRALAADLTGAGWQKLDTAVPVITEAEAGRRLVRLSRDHAFTLFEFFLTDKAGHSKKARRAVRILGAVDAFLHRVTADLNPAETLLLITSDHGNLEDLSTKSHTRHPVPLVAYGRGAHHFRRAEDLTDVVPALLTALADEA